MFIYECVLLTAHLCTNTMAKRDYDNAYSFKSMIMFIFYSA